MQGLMKMWVGRNNNLPWPKNHDEYAIWARSRWEAQVVLARYLGVYDPRVENRLSSAMDHTHGSVVHRQGMDKYEYFYQPPRHARLVSATDYVPEFNPEGFERHRPHIRLCSPFIDEEATTRMAAWTGKVQVPANPFEDVDELDDELDDKFIPNPRNHEGVSIHPECEITRNPRNSA